MVCGTLTCVVVTGDSQEDDPSLPVTFTATGIRRGARRLLPICVFIVPFGIAFGVAATERDLSPAQAILMSLFVFTATAQFAALDFLTEPVAYLSLGLVVAALSGRHVVMGAALSRWVNALPPARRFATLMFLSDANFADCISGIRNGDKDIGTLLGGGLVLWVTWVASTALGALGGHRLGDTNAYGFGVVMVCFFAATVTEMLRESFGRTGPVVAASVVSVVSLPVLPAGWNIILAAVVGGFVAVLIGDE